MVEPHAFTGNGPGVVGADNCQICFRWYDEHSRLEPTMLTQTQQDRALHILHNMALERTGWRSFFSRWIVPHEPLRNDAANLIREVGYQEARPYNSQFVGCPS
jgi:hypothetical protein